MLLYIKTRHIERIGFLEGDADLTHKGVLDGLATIYGDGIIEGRYNLNGHPGFNLYAVADFLMFRGDCKECHNYVSLFLLINSKDTVYIGKNLAVGENVTNYYS